ncbi:MAG: hypothetical protein RR224_11265, partial [Clostridia bacterium]
MAYNKSLLKVAIIFLYLISILSTAYILFIVIKGNFIYFYKDIVLCFIAMIVSQLVATQIGIKKLIFRKPNHIMSASRIMALIQYCLL